MFEGYFSCRRRRCLISIIFSLIFLTFIFLYNQLNIPKQVHIPSTQSLDAIITENNQLPLQKISNGVLSVIEFFNSPNLDLEFQSSNILPIIVLSKASNFAVRDAIRRTWAFDQLYQNDTIQVKVFFLVGTDDYTIKRVHAEQMIFNDIILVSLPDLYSFIAYREVSAMIWVRLYLPNALFYIKTEEDVIINMKAIINQLLPIIESVTNENLVIGWFGLKYFVQRDTYQNFINAVIPLSYIDIYYAMSLLYIVTSNASDRMLDALSHIDIIEYPGDPFVTGFLREAAHVQIKNLATPIGVYQYELSNGTCTEEFQKNSRLLLCKSSLRIGSSRSIFEYFEAWNTLLSQT